MPVSFEIEMETGVVLGTFVGEVSLDDARQAAATLWKTPGWPGRAAVWDLREARLKVSTDEVRIFAEFMIENQPETPPERMVFVTGRDVDFGMSRIFEVYREDSQTEFRVLRDYDDALAWARSTGSGGP